MFIDFSRENHIQTSILVSPPVSRQYSYYERVSGMNFITVNKLFKIQKTIHARAESSEKVAGNINVLVTLDTFPLHIKIQDRKFKNNAKKHISAN